MHPISNGIIFLLEGGGRVVSVLIFLFWVMTHTFCFGLVWKVDVKVQK